jgi:DNA (cytosine-5)-methyltransferase 3A
MNVLSLFDGMSCGQIALQKLGIKVDKYFACEIDKYAMQVTQNNFPDTIQLGDVQFVTKETLGNHKIDLILGGSPCQGFSFAGKNLNFQDPRSALFFEFVRLVKELKPKYFLLENVRMKKESRDIISDYMGCEPIEINSALMSAQNRRRLYWTNIPGVTQPKDKGIVLKDIILSGSECDMVVNVGKDIHKENIDKSHCLLARDYKGFPNQPFTGVRVSKPINPNSTNQINPDKSAKSKSSDEIELNDNVLAKDKLYWRKLTPIECERLQTVPDNYTDCVSNTQRYKMLGNGWTVDVVAHILKGINIS